jgi:Methyltransferase domain
MLARLMGHNRLFRFWERMGLHVTPVHFYQPTPDTRNLNEKLWKSPSAMPGVQIDLDEIVAWFSQIVAPLAEEFRALADDTLVEGGAFRIANNRFESVDAECLYGLIRTGKPKRILEIGMGYSTVLAAEAIERNMRDDPSYSCDLKSIDPYPNETLVSALGSSITINRSPVQDISLSEIEALNCGDILFIDSTHVLAIGSDVQFELLEMVPRVKPGVFVHFHDIFLPREYPREWIHNQHRFWTEQYILQAFLAFNDSFKVIWPGQLMHAQRTEVLEKLIPSYCKDNASPGSFWIQRKHL